MNKLMQSEGLQFYEDTLLILIHHLVNMKTEYDYKVEKTLTSQPAS
jgi:hypothetical protein